MAHYPNGHSPYYGQSNNSAAAPQPSRIYTSQSSQQNPHGLRRMPSYMVGDDAALFDNSQGQNMMAADGNPRYTVRAGAYKGGEGQEEYSLANSGRDDGLYAQGASTDVSRARAASQSQGLYYASSIATSPTQAGYNPQQYAVPPTPSQQLGYNPLAYGAGSAGSGHQPYNPAAYQSPTVGAYGSLNTQLQTNAASHYAQTPVTPHPYSLPQPQAPPPPPPRGPDHPYGSRPAVPYTNNSTDSQYAYASQQAASPTVASASLAYNVGTPSSPSTYASGSVFTPGLSSRTSLSYSRSSQVSAYASQSPRRTEAAMASPYDEQPPEPPAHDEGYVPKWPGPARTGSGRSLPTPPISQNQPQLSPRRTDTLTRHPQSRPLPGPPPDADEPAPLAGVNGVGSLRRRPEEDVGYDDLMHEVEEMATARRHSSRSHGQETDQYGRPIANASLSPDERHTHTNGSMETGTGHVVNYGAYSDDSDAEAEAGLAMLQMADEEEKAHRFTRRDTNASIFDAYASPPSPEQEFSRNGDYLSRDQGVYGSYEGHRYGDEADYSHDDYGDDGRLAVTPGSDDRGNYSDDYDYPNYGRGSGQFHQGHSHARVDHGGTGGLAPPSAYGRRMSFDYGDEEHPDHHSTSEGSEGGMPEDLFFHPGMRPLPPAPVEPVNNASVIPHLMPAGTYRHQDQGDLQIQAQYTQPYFPASPNSFGQTVPSPTQVPRSTSLSSHPIGPRTDPPIRSKTDADRAKYRLQQELLRQQSNGNLKFDPSEADPIALDLPTIPGRRKKFNLTKLSSEQFKRCTEPWALSAVLAWIRELSEDETDLREQAIVDAIVALFTHKVPTMNIADAETLAARVVKNMLEEEALVQDEEWVKFGSGSLSGVLFQITGTGCYSSKLHEQESEVFGRCYSHHCMRTLKKVNLKTQMMEPQKKAEDWVTFYKVSKEVFETHPKKEIDRQNNLHEIVTTEDAFIGQLDVLRELYRDQLANMSPSVINPKRLPKFLNDVFGRVDAVKKVNEDFLLAQLKYRQKEQGPFIVGFSDIFREWIRKAKVAYVEYAATFPRANYLVRKEAERNAHFRTFLNHVREHKSSHRLSWDTYLKAPITRIQRYTLLLSTVHKNMLKDSEEKSNLLQAIDEIKHVALECDNKVGETSKKVDLMELSSKLQLRPEMKEEVELNLEHLGREIIFRGDLQRPGTRTRFLVDTHAILLDHYLILAKTVVVRDQSKTAKYENYDVSKLPIPMDLLVLESTNDDPVVKSSVRGVATVTPPQAVGRGGMPGPLTHTNSGNSANSGNSGISSTKTLVPTTVLESPKDDKILYPFKIKHLGEQGTYTLYAFSAQSRQDWCDKIIEAKTKHAASLFAQNAEPFRLRVLADAAFGYSDHSSGSTSVTIKGTPLDRAIKEVDERYASAGPRPMPICRTAVHSSTVFQQPPGRMMCAIGTDYGVYISEYNNPRGWFRAIPIMRVTQVAVFEEFNLFLLIADKSLIAYHLDAVCPANGAPTPSASDSSRKAPQKLSGGREVGFFAAGRMKDRTLVMYKKRDGLSSTFKVLEPVLQKSSTSRSRFFHSRRSQTEFFREYDEFYIPAESYSINMFHSSLAIATHRGIEILTIDKKQTWSVPDLRTETPEAQKYLTSIAQRIKELRPLGLFRLSDSEFLVAYNECAVYVNKHGDVSRSVVMEFVGRAHSACLYGKFLILFNQDFVEVRNAMNGRLRQVIPGHNVVCLDDGSKMPGSGANSVPTNTAGGVNLSSGLIGSTNGVSMASSGRTVKICMQHPEFERSLIVLELIENEGQKD
ncbi:hypothetical protein MW887_011648 [Aspergillus wentii]|nr:hypothetical protein MW887_011648 [Aspergillus wentii]